MRALVRALDERAEDLRRLGAKIIVDDYANYASILAALENVESAYFLRDRSDMKWQNRQP